MLFLAILEDNSLTLDYYKIRKAQLGDLLIADSVLKSWGALVQIEVVCEDQRTNVFKSGPFFSG